MPDFGPPRAHPTAGDRASLLRPPKALLDRVRWTFLQFSLISGCLLMVAVLTNHKSTVSVQTLGVAALAGLFWLWVEEYRRPLSVRWDVVEGVALVVVAVAVGNPLYMLLLLYGRLCFRSFTSSLRQAVAAGVIFFFAFFAPVLILQASGQQFSLQLVFLASGFPLCVAIMNTLHQTLDRLERSVEREQVLREAGAALVAATDRADIYLPSLEAALDLLDGESVGGAIVAVADKDGTLKAVAAAPAGRLPEASLSDALPDGVCTRLRGGAPFALHGDDARPVVAVLGFDPGTDVAVIPFLLRRALGGAIFAALAGPLPCRLSAPSWGWRSNART